METKKTPGNSRCLPKLQIEYFQLRSIKWCIGACICITVAILSIIWTPLDLILDEQLRMRPGLPSFDWWMNRPDIFRVKTSLFNITNTQRFLSGDDPKLKMEETRPIVFKFVSNISNVVFNDNGTLSYNISYHCIYDPSINSVDLNATVSIPNLVPLLSMSHMWNANYFVKMLFNQVIERYSPEVIIKRTIYEILFNNTDRLLTLGNGMLPVLMPWKNLGLIPLIYNGVPHRVTVFIGTKHGHRKYFLINKYDGDIHVPNMGSKCKDNIVNSYLDGVFSQFITKTEDLKVFNPFICKNDVYSFEDEVYYYGIKGYRFLLLNNSYDRTEPSEEDCYKGEPSVPNGTSSIAPCYNSYPVTASFPHFLFGSEELKYLIDGMRPNESEHRSFVIVEPMTGIILNGMSTLQANIHVRPLKGFPKQFEKFGDKIIPLMTSNLYFHEPAYRVLYILHFVLLLPIIGSILTAFLLVCGLFCLWKSKKPLKRKKAYTSSEDQGEEISEAMMSPEKSQS